MEEKRTVRLVSKDKRYANTMYPSIAVYREDIGTYLTGQHIDPKDPSTFGNLTPEQMIGKVPLTKEQSEKFNGFIINPENQLNLKHGRLFDLSIVNGKPISPKDYWEYNYLKYQDIVALKKEDYKPQLHRFYLEDKEYEAKERISKRDKIYKAVEKVRSNLSIEKLSNLAIMLNYYVTKFNVDPNKISKTQLEDKIYEQCEQNPDGILKCFETGWEDNLYILKLANDGIIKRKGDDFIDGGIFIGRGLDGVKAFMSKEENRATINKWASLGKKISVIEDNNSVPKEDSPEVLKVYSEGIQAILEDDKAKITHCKKRLIEMGSLTYLEKLNKQIEKSQDPNIEDIPSLQALKMKAGRLKLPKEEWGDLDQEKLFEYLKNK